VPLGPRYDGAQISRDAATGEDEDEDEDDPFSKGFDEEESEDDVEDAAELSASEGEDEDVSDEDEDMQDGDESPATDISDEDDDDEEEDDDDEEAEDKTELRKMMAEEQKTVAASLSQAAKQDAEKGRAVKTQRTTFDSLLNTRIKLQKALIGTNTLTGVISDSTPTEDTQDAFLAAETAAFTLWSTLNSQPTHSTHPPKTSGPTCAVKNSQQPAPAPPLSKNGIKKPEAHPPSHPKTNSTTLRRIRV
jgi:protein AATF/BFR2